VYIVNSLPFEWNIRKIYYATGFFRFDFFAASLAFLLQPEHRAEMLILFLNAKHFVCTNYRHTGSVLAAC